MEAAEPLGEVRRSLEQAKRMLRESDHYMAEEWMLLATLIGDADKTLRVEQASPELRALLADAIDELRGATMNFTAPDFLRATKAARRRNQELFSFAG